MTLDDEIMHQFSIKYRLKELVYVVHRVGLRCDILGVWSMERVCLWSIERVGLWRELVSGRLREFVYYRLRELVSGESLSLERVCLWSIERVCL